MHSYKSIEGWRNVFWVICFVLFSARMSYAVNLGQLIVLALEKDPVYKTRQYNALARKALGWQAGVGYGPTLRVNMRYGDGRESLQLLEQGSPVEEKSVDFYRPELLFSLVQPLVDLEKFYLAKWGASEITAAKVELRQARENLVLRVCEKYIALLVAEENYRLAQEECRSLKRQQEDAAERLLIGYGTVTDEQSAQARYAISLAALLERQTQRDRMRKELEEVVGVDIVEKIDDFPEGLKLPELAKDAAYWENIALQFNSGYKLAQIQQTASKEKLRSAQGKFLPVVDFFADYSEKRPSQTLSDYGETRKEAILGVRLEMEILSSGRDSFGLVAALREARAAEQNVEAQKRHLLSTVQVLWLSLHNTLQLVGHYAAAVESSEQFMLSTKEGFLEGRHTLLDVLNSQQEYFRMLSQYRSSRYNYLLLCQQFRNVLGIGDDFDFPLNIYQIAENKER